MTEYFVSTNSFDAEHVSTRESGLTIQTPRDNDSAKFARDRYDLVRPFRAISFALQVIALSPSRTARLACSLSATELDADALRGAHELAVRIDQLHLLHGLLDRLRDELAVLERRDVTELAF